MRPKGYIIDVPVTLTIAVRGAKKKDALRIARHFADALNPTQAFIDGYNSTGGEADSFVPGGVMITEATLESSTEDPCDVMEELAAEDDSPESGLAVWEQEQGKTITPGQKKARAGMLPVDPRDEEPED